MKNILVLLALFSQSLLASWAEIDLKKAVCEGSILIFTCKYKNNFEKDYFHYTISKQKNEYWFNRANFFTSNILKNDQSKTYKKNKSFEGDISILVNGRCKGNLCHMSLKHKIGDEGIWLVSARHQHSGEFLLYNHPSIPLPIEKLSIINKLINKCNE